MINIHKEVKEFIDQEYDNQVVINESITRCVKSVNSITTWFDPDKSTDWNISYLQNILENDPYIDCGDYNFDVAFLNFPSNDSLR